VPTRQCLVVSGDRAFPYSKGLMAQSLMACGIAPDRAYRIARIVEVELRRSSEPLLTTQELRDVAAGVLAREEGEESVSRYRRWHELRHLERPLIVLIGGAPGTGKSTVATQVAHRLGITRIVSSDVVRQVMRGVIAPEVLPQIHTSSFEAADLIPIGAAGDRTIAGFWQQAETVRAGLRNVVSRAVEERFPLVIEGVHIVPGTPLIDDLSAAHVVEVLLCSSSPEQHRANFLMRAENTSDSRPALRYLAAFPAIRQIHDFLLLEADRSGTPVVDATDIDAAVRSVMDLVISRVAVL
jgi:2-phosphoglycerate kinase